MMKQEIFDSMASAKLGRKLERLGLALQDPKSKIPKIVRLSSECGLDFQFRIMNKPPISQEDV